MLAADSIITLLCCIKAVTGWRHVLLLATFEGKYFSLKVNVCFRLLHTFNNKLKTCYNFLFVAFTIFIENKLKALYHCCRPHSVVGITLVRRLYNVNRQVALVRRLYNVNRQVAHVRRLYNVNRQVAHVRRLYNVNRQVAHVRRLYCTRGTQRRIQ